MSKQDKNTGRATLGGDSRKKHLRKAGKRRANKASRKAAKIRS